MGNRKYRIYIEQKGVFLTQIGYLKTEKEGYKLVDKEFADEFSSAEAAVKAIQSIAGSLDWGQISSLKRKVEEITK